MAHMEYTKLDYMDNPATVRMDSFTLRCEIFSSFVHTLRSVEVLLNTSAFFGVGTPSL